MLENFNPITIQELLTLIDVKIYKSKSPMVNKVELASVFRKIAKYINQIDEDLFSETDIINALDSTEPGKALDSRQGKILKDSIDALSTDLTEEILDRIDAEDDLQNAISAETTARIAAIIALQDQIDDSITQTDIDNSISNYNDIIQGGAPSDANTLNKINNKIILGVNERSFSNITLRNNYAVPSLPFQAYVVDDGDGRWALYKALSTGTNATYIKISDPDFQNAAPTALEIKGLYESNSNTNAFTDTLLTKLNSVAAGATANLSNSVLLARANHTGTQVSSTISDFAAASIAVNAGTYVPLAGGVSITGSLNIQSSQIGEWVGNSAYARFGHSSYNGGSNFGFVQADNGNSYVVGTQVYIQSGSNINITGNIINTGNIEASGTVKQSVTTGMLKAVGGVITLAIAGTDYLAAGVDDYIKSLATSATAQTVNGININTVTTNGVFAYKLNANVTSGHGNGMLIAGGGLGLGDIILRLTGANMTTSLIDFTSSGEIITNGLPTSSGAGTLVARNNSTGKFEQAAASSLSGLSILNQTASPQAASFSITGANNLIETTGLASPFRIRANGQDLFYIDTSLIVNVSGAFTIGGKSLSLSGTNAGVQLATTGSSVLVLTLPSANATVATLGLTETFTGNKTFSGSATFSNSVSITPGSLVIGAGTLANIGLYGATSSTNSVFIAFRFSGFSNGYDLGCRNGSDDFVLKSTGLSSPHLKISASTQELTLGYINGYNINFALGSAALAVFDGKIFIKNYTAPAAPSGGGILFVESGALKYIGSSGTVTTLGPA